MTETIRYAWGHTSLGRFLAVSSDRGLVAVELTDSDHALRDRFGDVVEDAASMAAVVDAVAAAIEHPEIRSDLAIDPRGSELELRVWAALREIPPGETTTYGGLAARLGIPDPREVGAACAANTLAVLVPCHRVVKKDGAIGAADWRAFAFFSTVTTLGTPQDVTLQEVRIECFFPAGGIMAA